MSSTLSVGMNLARRFNAGSGVIALSRRIATIEFSSTFRRRYATRNTALNFPGLEKAGLNSYRRYASKKVILAFFSCWVVCSVQQQHKAIGNQTDPLPDVCMIEYSPSQLC